MNVKEYPHESQELFFTKINANILNNLLHTIESKEFKEYVDNKFNNKIKIKGEIKNSIRQSKSLYIYFKKGTLQYMHFSIHLSPSFFDPKLNPNGIPVEGLLHFVENIKNKSNITKNISRKKKPFIVIKVEIPENKEKLLKFSLTPPENELYYKFSQESLNDAQLFINILNEYFNENNEKYLNKYTYIKHTELNSTLNNIKKSKVIQNNSNIKKYSYNNFTRKNHRKTPIRYINNIQSTPSS
jgi:hypothetical protein